MKNLSGLLAVLALFLCTLFSFGQTNLIQNSSWGDMNTTTNLPRYFSGYGANYGAVNTVEIGEGPQGNMVTLWKGVANLNTGQGENQDGGPMTSFDNIDIAKAYRFTVWVKKKNSFDGKVLLGPQVFDAAPNTNRMVLDANGNTVAAPYCVNGDLPSLDEWYLLVGFIHESTYDLANNATQSMVYDEFGNAVTSLTLTDYKFDPNAVRMRPLSIQVQNANANDEIFFYAPTFFEVNSQMPSITSMLSPVSTANTVWNVDGSDVNYTTGKVGIGTNTPDNTLTVAGADLDQSSLLIRNTSYSSTDAAGTASLKFGFANHFGPVVEATKFATNISGLNLYGEYGYNVPQQLMTLRPTSVGPRIGIGTSSPDMMLTVKGNIHAQEVKVDLDVPGPDYVFKENYHLRTLEEIQAFIDDNGHLPNIPSALDMETNGVELGAMEMKLLEKIEELTLYIIQQNKNQKQLEARMLELENK